MIEEGRFGKYEQELKHALSQEQLSGEDMAMEFIIK